MSPGAFACLGAFWGRVPSPAEELQQRAYVRVMARHGVPWGSPVPGDAGWLSAEIQAEVGVLAAKAIVRRAKRIRRAVREMAVMAEAGAAAGRVPDAAAAVAEHGFADFDPGRFRLVRAEAPAVVRGDPAVAAAGPRRPGSGVDPSSN